MIEMLNFWLSWLQNMNVKPYREYNFQWTKYLSGWKLGNCTSCYKFDFPRPLLFESRLWGISIVCASNRLTTWSFFAPKITPGHFWPLLSNLVAEVTFCSKFYEKSRRSFKWIIKSKITIFQGLWLWYLSKYN